MTEQNKISLFHTKGLLLAFIFCFLFTWDAVSQDEREKNLPDINKGSDHPNQFENPESSARDIRSDNFDNPRSSTKSEKSVNTNSSIKKDPQIYKMGGEKDIKKEGMSTLSFNLFLYIVDKFKED